MTMQPPVLSSETQIHEREIRRQEEKRMLEKYRDFFRDTADNLQQSNDEDEREWGKRISQIIAPKMQDNHFWFLVWKHVKKRDAEIGNILNSNKNEKKQILKFVEGIIDDVVAVTNLESDIRYDQLTGLRNKRKFIEDIKESGEHPVGKSLGILYVDLDKIKIANDKFGHDNTDLIIKAIAQRMTDVGKQAFDATENAIEVTPYRIGGDEMGFLIKTATPFSNEQYKNVVSHLISAISDEQYTTISTPWTQHVSCGAIRVSDHDIVSNNAADLVKWADGLQYLAKLTTGEARTPPEGEVMGALQNLIAENKNKLRDVGQKWATVFCRDIKSLYESKPEVEYIFDSNKR